jgi:hypothetical protein
MDTLALVLFLTPLSKDNAYGQSSNQIVLFPRLHSPIVPNTYCHMQVTCDSSLTSRPARRDASLASTTTRAKTPLTMSASTTPVTHE